MLAVALIFISSGSTGLLRGEARTRVYLTFASHNDYSGSNLPCRPVMQSRDRYLANRAALLSIAQMIAARGGTYDLQTKMHDNDFFAEDSAWLTVYLNGGRRMPPWNTTLRSPLLSLAQMAARWALWEGTVRDVAARRGPVVNLLRLHAMLRT